MLITPENPMLELKRTKLQQQIGSIVMKAYPKHMWRVVASEDGTTATVSCPQVSEKYGVVIHATHDHFTLERKVMLLCGELLERYGMKRDDTQFFEGFHKRTDGVAIRRR